MYYNIWSLKHISISVYNRSHLELNMNGRSNIHLAHWKITREQMFVFKIQIYAEICKYITSFRYSNAVEALIILTALTHAIMHHNIAKVNVLIMQRMTRMTTDKLMAVSQNHDSSDRTITEQFLNTRMLFGHQINAV